MKIRHALLTTIIAAVVGALVLGTPAMSEGQSLIHACVDNTKGTLRIVTAQSTCTSKEHALSWPAESSPGPGTTYYYRDRIFTVSPGAPRGMVVFCDDPDDTAVSGGYSWDEAGAGLNDSAIMVNWSCRLSGGTCSGSAGQDGWTVVAYLPTQFRNMTLSVTCAAAQSVQ
jgi:hypothetical protein